MEDVTLETVSQTVDLIHVIDYCKEPLFETGDDRTTHCVIKTHRRVHVKDGNIVVYMLAGGETFAEFQHANTQDGADWVSILVIGHGYVKFDRKTNAEIVD